MSSANFAMMVRVRGDVSVEQVNTALMKVRVRHPALVPAMGLGPDMVERVSLWKALSADLDARQVQPKFVDVRYPAAPFYGQ